MDYAYLHTKALIAAKTEAEAHETFRATCAVTEPQWTQCGIDPTNWIAPSDAAGGLCLWDDDGYLIRVEPSAKDPDTCARSAYEGLLDAGGVIGIVRATYASSGGRMVALCHAPSGWWIVVCRCEPTPRRGATEDVLAYVDPGAKIYVLSMG